MGDDGPAPFMSKVMQVFMSMDNMIGKDFEVGLAKLKTILREITGHSKQHSPRSKRCR